MTLVPLRQKFTAKSEPDDPLWPVDIIRCVERKTYRMECAWLDTRNGEILTIEMDAVRRDADAGYEIGTMTRAPRTRADLDDLVALQTAVNAAAAMYGL